MKPQDYNNRRILNPLELQQRAYEEGTTGNGMWTTGEYGSQWKNLVAFNTTLATASGVSTATVTASFNQVTSPNRSSPDVSSQYFVTLYNNSGVSATVTASNTISFGSTQVASELNSVSITVATGSAISEVISGVFYGTGTTAFTFTFASATTATGNVGVDIRWV